MPQVGQDSGHDAAFQCASALHLQSQHTHDLVAVDHLPLFVHQQAAVGISIKGDAKIVLPLAHRLAQRL